MISSFKANQAFMGRNRIAIGTLVNDKTGHEQIESLAMIVPPIARCLLVCRDAINIPFPISGIDGRQRIC